MVNRSRRIALEAAAFNVARYLREHEGYGGSTARALSALRRRRPGYSETEYRDLLAQGEELLTAAKQLARTAQDRLYRGWDAKTMTLDLGGLDKALALQFPALRVETCALALEWVFYWHHLR